MLVLPDDLAHLLMFNYCFGSRILPVSIAPSKERLAKILVGEVAKLYLITSQEQLLAAVSMMRLYCK